MGKSPGVHPDDLAYFTLFKRVNVQPRTPVGGRVLADLVPHLVDDNVR